MYSLHRNQQSRHNEESRYLSSDTGIDDQREGPTGMAEISPPSDTSEEWEPIQKLLGSTDAL